MIISNEPGYYAAGRYGIRTENLVVVREIAVRGAERPTLGFETISFAPIDLRLVEPKLLDAQEIAWLDAYHRDVRAKLSPLVDAETRKWLRAGDAAGGVIFRSPILRVIRGLDPRTQDGTVPASHRCRRLDGRVKPGRDAERERDGRMRDATLPASCLSPSRSNTSYAGLTRVSSDVTLRDQSRTYRRQQRWDQRWRCADIATGVMRMKGGHVYIMTNERDGDALCRRHQPISRDAVSNIARGSTDGFTRQHGLKRLVYYEFHEDIRTAFQREKTIKHWPRLVEAGADSGDEPRMGRSL